MNPAQDFVPGGARNVFINDRNTTTSKHASDFAQHAMDVLRMMKHVAEQHGIK
jgi:hypothetical protein